MLLLITSIILVAMGLYSILGRGSLWEAHVRRNTILGREIGDEAKWKRNLVYGGVILLVVGILGFVALATRPPGMV